MKTYIAKLLFNINIDQGHDITQFDEQVRLIKAHTSDEALAKAKTIGHSEEAAFTSPKQHLIKWEFVSVIAIYELESIQDGQQLYSYTTHKKDALTFIQFAKEKYRQLIEKSTIFA
jgi:Domain of unknown function (DUF4288)